MASHKATESGKTNLPIFPLSRYRHVRDIDTNTYYPYGNTPAEDFLETNIDHQTPSVLVLGCGDMRSFLYTLWKNLDSSVQKGPMRFDGVHFTLNDNTAAVLARNVLFMYMCLLLPREPASRKQWISAMWAIWYCHELYPHHLLVLNDSLKYLTSFSDSLEKWNNKDNTLRSLVKMDSATLNDINRLWNIWLSKAVAVSSVQEMRKLRREKQGKLNDMHEHCYYFTKDNVSVHGEAESTLKRKINARCPEVMSYINSGSCFAENVFDLPFHKEKTGINLTMFDREDGKYTSFYGLIPFISYFHTFEFLSTWLAPLIPEGDVLVSPASFDSLPFLANSVQQFSMWVQSANRVLTDVNMPVSFSLHLGDAIKYCRSIQQDKVTAPGELYNYDVIATSNLMDHVGPINLVLSCIPLLKPNGVLWTFTMSCKFCSNTRQEFLSLLFGMDCQFFPIILGIRCISLEGDPYQSSVTFAPLLPDLSHERKRFPHNRFFLWEKVGKAHPLILSQLPSVEEGNLTEALVNVVGKCAYTLMNYSPKDLKAIIEPQGIETALLIMHTFINMCNLNSMKPYFWEPFCEALTSSCSAFVHCLQTQFLLHNIHTHLTVSEVNCPLCRQVALKTELQCLHLSLPSEQLSFCGFVFAVVHTVPSTEWNELKDLVKTGNQCFIFDVFYVKNNNQHKSSFDLTFFAPRSFSSKNYRATFFSYSSDINELASMFLKDLMTEWVNYDFLILGETPARCLPPSSFGTVSLHLCDHKQFKTEISLSKEAKVKLKKHALQKLTFTFECL